MQKFLIELINQIPHFITQFIDWYDGLDEFIFFFLEKTAFDLLSFCSCITIYSVIKLRYFGKTAS